MSLAGAAVKYKPIVVSLVIILMVWGTITFLTMPRREDPEFTIRVCMISTSWPGAPAQQVEELITDKIEQEVVGLEEVDTIRSTSRTGQSTLFVEIADEIPPAEIQNVWDKVRARVSLASMPDPSVHPIVNDQFGDTAVLLLAVHQTPSPGRGSVREHDRYTPRQLEQFGETIEDALRLLPGVAKVDKFGIRNEAVYIETDVGNWAQQGLTTQELERLVSQRNIIQPGGQISTDAGYVTVKPGGEFDVLDEIKQISGVVLNGDVDAQENSVYLSDLGLTVTRGYEDPPRYICRFGDHEASSPAVMVAVTMRSGSNIIDVCNASKIRVAELREYEKRLPPDIAATPVSDQSENVQAKISEVIINMIEAILIVIVVVYLVVGFRTSFVMAANIPVVVISSIGLIALLGVQLEQISLAAIIISLGLLVDNSVQVCDQARTNQIAGMPPYKAAIEGANTLAIPMLVGTLTTIAAFIPMMFMLEGGGKEYVYSLPVTVSTTLGLSWVLAMTLCVILAGMFIRAPRSGAPASPPVRWMLAAQARLPHRLRRSDSSESNLRSKESSMQRLYGAVAMIAIRYKWSTLVATVVLCIAIMTLPVSSEFFPDASRDQFAVKITLPEIATIEQTDAVAAHVEEALRKLSKVADVEDDHVSVDADVHHRLRAMRTMVGGGGSRWNLAWNPEPPARNFAEILVRTSDARYTTDYVEDVRIACVQGDPQRGIEPIVGAQVTPVKLALGPPADPLVFRVLGSGFADPVLLRDISSRLKRIVSDQPETWGVNDSWGVNGYQMQVDVDRDRATLSGITNSQIAQTLNSYYSGLRLTTFREGDHQVPIYFRLRPEGRRSIRSLQEAFVEGDKGKVPLSTLAQFHFSWEPEKIQRRDMNRVIEVSSRMLLGVTGNDVVERVLASKEMKELNDSLPVGYWIEVGGAYEESQESGDQMLLSFVVSLVLIVLCLIFQYNGWSKPLMILCTLPLALVGAWLGLALSGNSLGFMPQLGILALFGIVLNTAIIFVEFADILIAERQTASGVALDTEAFCQCLIDAGKQRMLPIFLTTATTVGGLLPLALGGGPLWVGLAWCMIIGLLFTTVLTLFVLPALYAVLAPR